MINRIDEKFNELKKSGKKALIAYITAGVPSLEETLDLAVKLSESGVDILEIGIPFSDPIADGPVIQKAAEIAIRNGVNADKVFSLAADLRKRTTMPIIFMLYYNSIYRYGIDSFVRNSFNSGVDGFIVPDLPFEESRELKDALTSLPLNLISLVSLASKERLPKLLSNSSGFVYCISTLGVTGEREIVPQSVKSLLSDIAGFSSLPRIVGFGLSRRDQVEELKEHCEGIVVGSAIMRRVMEKSVIDAVSFVRDLRKFLDGS